MEVKGRMINQRVNSTKKGSTLRIEMTGHTEHSIGQIEDCTKY